MKSKNKLIKILFITSLTFPTLSGISVSANSSEKFRQEFKNKKIIEKNIIDDQIKSKNIHAISKEYKFISLKTLKIETDRLVIAPTVEQDIEKLSEYLMENEVTKYLDLGVEYSFQTKEQAINFLKNKGSDEIIDAVEFTIKLKDSGLPIGKLDLMLFENSILSLGYWLGKDFQGKGYMSEACYKVVNKAFNASDIEMLYIACDFNNAPSIKLADRIFDHISEMLMSWISPAEPYQRFFEKQSDDTFSVTDTDALSKYAEPYWEFLFQAGQASCAADATTVAKFYRDPKTDLYYQTDIYGRVLISLTKEQVESIQQKQA